MRIGIFGHSDAVFRTSVKNGYRNVGDIVADTFPNDQIDWFGVGQCSAERLLLLLEKHKNYDFYLIFHSNYSYMYCPSWNKDAHVSDMTRAAKNKKTEKTYYEMLQSTGNSVDSWSPMIINWIPDKKVLLNRWIGTTLLINKFCLGKNTKHVYMDFRTTKFLNKDLVSHKLSKYLLNRKNWQEEHRFDSHTIDKHDKEIHINLFSNLICEEIQCFKNSLSSS